MARAKDGLPNDRCFCPECMVLLKRVEVEDDSWLCPTCEQTWTWDPDWGWMIQGEFDWGVGSGD